MCRKFPMSTGEQKGMYEEPKIWQQSCKAKGTLLQFGKIVASLKSTQCPLSYEFSDHKCFWSKIPDPRLKILKANEELNLTKVDAKFKPHLITNWIEFVAQSHNAREEAYPIWGLKSIILVSILLCTSPFIHNAWHKIKNYIKQEF